MIEENKDDKQLLAKGSLIKPNSAITSVIAAPPVSSLLFNNIKIFI